MTASIKAVRVSSPGLTEDTLGAEQALMEVLGTDDPAEGVALLSAYVNRLTEVKHKKKAEDAQALRAALGIGLHLHANVSGRRRTAIKEGLFYGAWRTQFYAEERAIKELVDFLIEEADKQEPTEEKVNPFQSAEPVVLDDPDLDASAEPDEPDDQPSPPAGPEEPSFLQTLRSTLAGETKPVAVAREYARQLGVVAAGVVALAVVVVLDVTGNLAEKPDATPPPDKVVSATVPSGVTVKGSAAPKLDNSRGWGPARKTYTWKHPASFPVFNSITDNPYWGDERNFLQCKDTAKDGQSWGDELVAKDGHTYECSLYIGNDVDANLDTNMAARLQNARVRLSLPDERMLNPGFTGVLSADNAQQVWDSCNFVAARPVTLLYVRGSARLHTNGTPKEGVSLPGTEDTIIHDNGALLGDAGDGIIGQNAGYLSFQISVVLG
ncbi:hypothetical protein ACFRMN_19620 [Streptomyces sp. NPDC056835]|uniref:hypothetical protein n=1 Tax=Streptomyces sp. NPDC056835 TaxID=3345956 RepID=UPI003682BF5C